jgi:hypothetical protein
MTQKCKKQIGITHILQGTAVSDVIMMELL